MKRICACCVCFDEVLYTKALERLLRKDGLDWRIAAYTTGDIPGADYWGIEE